MAVTADKEIQLTASDQQAGMQPTAKGWGCVQRGPRRAEEMQVARASVSSQRADYAEVDLPHLLVKPATLATSATPTAIKVRKASEFSVGPGI